MLPVTAAFAAFQAAMWSHARTEARVVARDTAALVARSGVAPDDARASATAILEADTDLRNVVVDGYAQSANIPEADLAGKTGTTNDYKDAWFNGYNESLVAVTWVGHDDSTTLGRYEEGGRAALPAWIAYMKVALEGVEETTPSVPEGIVSVYQGNGEEYEDVTVEAIYDPEVLAVLDEKPREEDDLF